MALRYLFGLFGFAAILYLAVLPLLPIGFADHDTMYTAIRFWTEGDYYAWVTDLAERQGRWQVYVSSTLQAIPFLVPKFWFYKTVSIASILIGFAAFAAATGNLFRSYPFGVAMGLLYLLGLTLTTDHSLLTGYFVTYHLFVCLYMLSLVALDLYLVREGARYLAVSALLYLGCCLIREFAVVYFIFFPILIWVRRRQEQKRQFLRNASIALSPYILIVLAYTASYFAYRTLFPSAYAGNIIDPDSFSIAHALNAVVQLSTSAIPLSLFFDAEYRQFFRYYGNDNGALGTAPFGLPILLQPAWFVRAAIGAVLAAWLVLQPGRVRQRITWVVAAGIGAVAVFLPNALLAVTPGYQAAVSQGRAFSLHMTYFSYLGVVIFLAALLLLLGDLLRSRTKGLRFGIAGLAAAAAAVISLGTDYSNALVSEHLEMVHQKWEAMDVFLESDTFQDVPEGAAIYGPSLWQPPYWAYYTIRNFSGSHLVPEPQDSESYWSKYARFRTGKSVRIFADRAELMSMLRTVPAEPSPYFLRFAQDATEPRAFVAFARIGDVSEYGLRLYSDRVDVFSGQDRFSVDTDRVDLRRIELRDDEVVVPATQETPLPVFTVGTTYNIEDLQSDGLHPVPGGGEGLRLRQPAYFHVDVAETGLYEVLIRARRDGRPEADLTVAVDAAPASKWVVPLSDSWAWHASPFAPRLTAGRHLIELGPGVYDMVFSEVRVDPVAVNPDLPPKVGLSRSFIDDGTLHVTGWAIAPQPITRVELVADGRRLGEVPYGLPRPDVLRGHPAYRNAYAGFAIELPLASSPPEAVVVEIYSGDERIATGRRPVER